MTISSLRFISGTVGLLCDTVNKAAERGIALGLVGIVSMDFVVGLLVIIEI